MQLTLLLRQPALQHQQGQFLPLPLGQQSQQNLDFLAGHFRHVHVARLS
jgi:hypothetical protein